jgi:hypothetical protein
MRHALHRNCVGLPALAIAVAGFASSAWAQTSFTPPDFSGVWRRAYQISNLLDPPPSGLGPIMQDPRYPKTDHNGVLRRPITEAERPHVVRQTTSWIPDPSSPILQPRTRAALEKIRDQELAGIPHPEMQTMCMPSGVPHIVNILNSTMILQTPTEVIFLYERDHQVRHVYLNRPHAKEIGHTWYGDSVGHYEGDTLVVDTIGLTDKTHIDRFATPHSHQIHVVERYRLMPDGKRIEALVTVEDPVTFTTPWSGLAVYVPTDGTFLENVCAENQRQEFWPGVEIPTPVDDTPDF